MEEAEASCVSVFIRRGGRAICFEFPFPYYFFSNSSATSAVESNFWGPLHVTIVRPYRFTCLLQLLRHSEKEEDTFSCSSRRT